MDVKDDKADIKIHKKPDFTTQVTTRVARKLDAQDKSTQSLWFGLGMMGLIGWSVVVPTLLGAALGLWLDAHYPDQRSWTLALLIGGLTIGCFNAWYWLDKEHRAIHDKHPDQQEDQQEDQHHDQRG